MLIVANDPASRAQVRTACEGEPWHVLECPFDGVRLTAEAFQLDAVVIVADATAAAVPIVYRDLAELPPRRIALVASPARAVEALHRILAQ